ncbi:oogenesis-related [Corythoichthys intestinalis]|uniref:oogenesis-related n=1 Tax=Corythoichthys intestinalis TaxID=161448 RepID=UPI0025A56686|nr:oogenesis-related [Corythoichthys intestinalis]
MTTLEEQHHETVEQTQGTEGAVEVRRFGLLRTVLRGFFWPFGIVVGAYRGFWWVLGFRQTARVSPAVSSSARQCLTGHKRLHPITRLLLKILPRWAQGFLGFPVSTAIGCSLSPEISVSPTKPCGKGSKRKQDDLEDDDEEDEEHQTWVEALTQELDDEGPEKDPDYEPSSVETESEEYRSHNSTESDEFYNNGVIEDVETGDQLPSP